jgi:hypothetical protein
LVAHWIVQVERATASPDDLGGTLGNAAMELPRGSISRQGLAQFMEKSEQSVLLSAARLVLVSQSGVPSLEIVMRGAKRGELVPGVRPAPDFPPPQPGTDTGERCRDDDDTLLQHSRCMATGS